MSSRAHRLLLLVVSLQVVALLVFGIVGHRVSVAGGEYDFYAERAELLARGTLANDVFHGWLFPLLTTAAMACVGDAFAAGRLVSAVAAGVAVYATHRWAHHRFGGAAAAWTTALLVCNPVFARLGVQAASDMTAAAFVLLAVWLQLRAATWRGWLAAGLCLGAAASTRPACLPLAAIFVLAAWSADRHAASRGGRRRTAVVAGTVTGLLPHLVLTTLQFGSPLVNENWRVLASKVAGWDTDPLRDPAPGSLLTVLSQHGAELLRLGVGDWWQTWTRAIGSWLVGGSAVAGLAVTVSVGAFVACAADAFRHRGRAAVTTAVLAVWTALVAFTYEPVDRMLLPIVPLVLATTIACVLRASTAGKSARLVLCTWLALVVAAVPAALSQFARAHAVGEVALATRLRAEHGPTVTIATTFPCLGLHARVRAIRVTPPAGAAATAVWACIAAEASAADYFVTSTVSQSAALSELAATRPPGAEVVWNEDGVLAVRLPMREVAWLDEATVVPEPARAGVSLLVRTKPLPDLLGAGFVVEAPGREPMLLPLVRGGPGEFVATMPWSATSEARERWRFVPACMLADGRILRASAIELDLP